MLSFATEFPVNVGSNQDFLDGIRAWILGSPHTAFRPADLEDIPETGAWSKDVRNARLEALINSSEEEQSAAVRVTILQGDLEWVTTVAFSRRPIAWIGVRTARESKHPAVRLPEAKKPLVVQFMLERFGGGADGDLIVQQAPHYLTEGDIERAGRLILGEAGCRLPMVYLSSGFAGEKLVDADLIARDLAGMSHVVVEPSRPFSRRLQIEVASENVYGGAIGVYWPEGAGRRSFFTGRDFTNPKHMAAAIVEEVRTALANRRPLFRSSWSAVQEGASKQAINLLKSSGSGELQSYIDAFDSEMNVKQEQLAEAESEISRLKAELRRYESSASKSSSFTIRRGGEQELFPGEISAILRDALSDAAARIQPDSRREHVVSAVLASLPDGISLSDKRDELKEILRDYRSMTADIQKSLQNLGFSVSGEGKHYKLIYHDDDRYTFTLPKSGSDKRGGLNAVSDISKRLF